MGDEGCGWLRGASDAHNQVSLGVDPDRVGCLAGKKTPNAFPHPFLTAADARLVHEGGYHSLERRAGGLSVPRCVRSAPASRGSFGRPLPRASRFRRRSAIAGRGLEHGQRLTGLPRLRVSEGPELQRVGTPALEPQANLLRRLDIAWRVVGIGAARGCDRRMRAAIRCDQQGSIGFDRAQDPQQPGVVRMLLRYEGEDDGARDRTLPQAPAEPQQDRRATPSGDPRRG